jgi:predicted nucleotidyltransferase
VELNRPLSTVTPTLDGDILTVLATNDAPFTTGQIHRILTKNSEEGIRKALRRLTSQGIVQSDRIGNAFTYRFNRDHLAATYIAGLARLHETFLARLESNLKAWRSPPVYAAVFGSAARGQMTTSSDVDLLLVRPHTAADAEWEEQVNDLAITVTRWLGNDTRILELNEKEIATRGHEEPVLNDILQEGLTVAGTRSWLASKLRSGKS